MRKLASVTSALLGTLVCLAGGATEAPDGFWVTPTIKSYGRMHWLPKAAYQPDRAQSYKIVFSLSVGSKTPGEVNPALDRVARSVNLFGAAGVPPTHLQVVAVASGAATSIVLNDAQYRAAFGTANPNLPLIAALRKVGVDIAVCGQAVAEHDYQYEWVDPSVTIALSALTTIMTLEHQGYALMPL